MRTGFGKLEKAWLAIFILDGTLDSVKLAVPLHKLGNAFVDGGLRLETKVVDERLDIGEGLFYVSRLHGFINDLAPSFPTHLRSER